MAGIYIHIPFCKQACSYCNFHFSTSLKRKAELVDCLSQEIRGRRSYLADKTINSIYFGGGTPSLLSQNEINSILGTITDVFEVDPNAEITLEANPDDLSDNKIKELKQTGINRLSIGVQSFHQVDLDFMNRAHNAEEAINSIQMAQDVGFENLNIDLIFGSQTTSDEMWLKNIETFVQLKVPHLSSYSLTIEEKTALQHWVKNGKSEPLDEDKNFRHYEMLLNSLNPAGYQQYELSNYCIDEKYSKHNKSYWFGEAYLGIGPSAHSYNGISRQWNLANNLKYIQAIQAKQSFNEIEQLTEENRYTEYLLTRLRTKWGVKIDYVKQHFSDSIFTHFMSQLNKLPQNEVDLSDNQLIIKPIYRFKSDEIVRQLMH